jgi:branched-chain amino acid transport system substrate-binding protein
MRHAVQLAALALALAAVALGGCAGQPNTAGDTVSGDVLRVYASQPLSGALAPEAQAIVRGERLALEHAGGRVGKWRIDYRTLDDADPVTGLWAPGVVSANARRAAQDDKTIAYLGEMGTGASAVSIPILNETGILVVSPTDSVAGFTRKEGAAPGEPDKYYPTKKRNFARLVPPDDVQSAALLQLLQDAGAKRLFVVHDQKLYGQGISRAVARGAPGKGIEVVKVQGVDVNDDDPARLAADVAATEADAFLYSGEPSPRVPALYGAVAGAAPRARLLGTYTQVNDAFTRALAPGLTVTATAPWLELKAYGAAAQRVAKDYRTRYREVMPTVALYGYEAMRALLEAIRRSGKKGNDRAKVVDRMHKAHARDSVLGTYSIDRKGDVSTKVYGAYRVRGGRLSFLRVLDPLGA